MIHKDETKEVEAIVELAKLINSYINDPKVPVAINKKLSKKLGFSLAKLDCAFWALENVMLDLRFGSPCESEEEEFLRRAIKKNPYYDKDEVEESETEERKRREGGNE